MVSILKQGDVGRLVGEVTVTGATPVTVEAPQVTDKSIVIFTLKTVGGTVGAQPTLDTITVGAGFDVVATAGDTSVYNYVVL